MRKILIITLISLVLIIGGVYFFYFRPRVLSGQPVPNVLTSFFPKVTSSGNSFGADDTAVNPDGTPVTATASKLKQLTPRPIAGYTAFDISTAVSIPSIDPKVKPTVTTKTDYYVRYVGRTNGYVYEIKNNEIPLQISNILIPNVYEAFFADSNNTALLRFLRPDGQTIATYSVPVPPLNPDNTRTQLSGVYLPDNIFSLAVSPDQKQIARITADDTGTTLSASTAAGKNIKALYKSPFNSWIPQWNASGIYLQTKAAASANGYVYAVDQTAARLRRIVGNVNGLTTSVSPSGAYVLYSESANSSFVTKVFNTKLGTTTTLSLKILPEKCTWLQNEDLICAGNNSVDNGAYPDAWYAGTTHFVDELYRITPNTNTYSVVFNDGARSFDMTNLQVDESQQYLYFVDKNTGILWKYSY
ncbi:MAG: seg [Candidatus Nomurabacteria bacterium]|nr:seg [Candidatus Nomurabacteria bacterium]